MLKFCKYVYLRIKGHKPILNFISNKNQIILAMKKIKKPLSFRACRGISLFFSILLLSTTSCNNDDDNSSNDPIDQLPPPTQTGENTFGCLLDGEPFLPGSGTNPLDCVYQFVNGGYYFSLQANREFNSQLIRLGCSTENLEIQENQTYILENKQDGNAYGKYFFETFFNYTTHTHIGQLTITKLDFDNNIVSGTFFYDIEDQNGIVHEIRDGRFDMQFTE